MKRILLALLIAASCLGVSSTSAQDNEYSIECTDHSTSDSYTISCTSDFNGETTTYEIRCTSGSSGSVHCTDSTSTSGSGATSTGPRTGAPAPTPTTDPSKILATLRGTGSKVIEGVWLPSGTLAFTVTGSSTSPFRVGLTDPNGSREIILSKLTSYTATGTFVNSVAGDYTVVVNGAGSWKIEIRRP